jgi:hypothetical protein
MGIDHERKETMDAIDQILSILDGDGPDLAIASISIAPFTDMLLRMSRVEYHYIAASYEDAHGVEMSISHVCLTTGGRLVRVAVDPDQREAYRLWDGEGREVQRAGGTVSS